MLKHRGKIIAIIQARMSATRLPGKVLMDIQGRPMLWHVVNRLRHAKAITGLVVATSVAKKDDKLASFLEKEKIDFCRGREEDVLDRYYKAALYFQSDVIVRITADCPLIDPHVTDSVVSVFLNSKKALDGASNIITRTFPRGLDTEVFSFQALERAWKMAKRPYHREHVTAFLYEHPELFKIKSVENKQDFSNLRWTVDEKEDLIFVRKVYARLYQVKKNFLMNDILSLLKKEESLKSINKGVRQKRIS